MTDPKKPQKILLIGNTDELRGKVEIGLRDRGYEVAVAQTHVTRVRHARTVAEEAEKFKPDAIVVTHMNELAFQYPAREEGQVQAFNPNMMLMSGNNKDDAGHHLHPVGLIETLRRPDVNWGKRIDGKEKPQTDRKDVPIIAFGHLGHGVRMCLSDNQVVPIRYTGKEPDGFDKLDKAVKDALTPRFGRHATE